MEIIKVHPQGFCKGVINAIKMTNDSLNEAPKPIYMLGSIVHNSNITNTYSRLGIITVKSLDEITPNKGSIIITAHGVSNYKLRKIKELNLKIIDTTCESVKQIQDIVRDKINSGFAVIYYGVKNHAECLGIEEDYIGNPNFYLIQNLEDLEKNDIKNEKVFFTNQTTMSYFKTIEIIEKVKEKYPHAIIKEDICYATKSRQLAFIESSKKTDFSIVVGDKNSNNTISLANICKTYANKPCALIENLDDLRNIDFSSYSSVSITSGASTPQIIVNEVINKINDSNYQSNIKELDYIKIKAGN